MAAYPVTGIAARWARLALLAALVIAVALSGVVLLAPPQGAYASRPEQTGGADQVTLKVGSGSVYSLPQGASVTLPISVSVAGPQPLAVASVLIQYDPAILRPTSCVRRPDAPAGFCNPAYDPENGIIRFNLLSDSGVTGERGLFDLTFEPAQGAILNKESQVTPLVESLADVQGNDMTSRAQGSAVRVVAGATTGTVVYVGTPDQSTPFTVMAGMTTTVTVWITPVTGLASGTFELAFNPAVVRALACHPYATTGGEGSGVCAVHTDHIRANLLSYAGLDGPVLAFEGVFTAADGSQPGDNSNLDITVEALLDISGAPIPAQTLSNTLIIDPGASPGVAALSIAPAKQNLYGNAPVTVHVFLDSATEVRAATWSVHYDPAVLVAEACQPAPEFANTVCNATGQPGVIRMSLLSVDPLAASVDVAAITFRRHPEAKPGSKSDLIFEVTNFADLAGDWLPYRSAVGEIQVLDELGATPAVTLRLQGAPNGGFNLSRGASLELPIQLDIDPQQPVGSLTGSLHYDPAVVRPTRCIQALSGVAGSPMGYCNAPYDPQEGIIHFTLLSQSGMSGTLTPFTVTMGAVTTASDGDTSDLNLFVESVSGPAGELRIWSTEDTVVHLQAPVSGSRVLIGPPGPQENGTYTVTLGYTVTVPVWLEGVTDLGTATLSISYDSTAARAITCIIHSDLIPEVDGGFCNAPAGTGTVRTNLISQQGFSSTGQVYDIVFAQGPSPTCGITTPLTVMVDSFVSVTGISIPATARHGRLDIACPISPPVPSIALRMPAKVEISWPHVTVNTYGDAVLVAYYEVWRDAAPYDVTAGAPIAQVAVPPGALPGTVFTFAEPPPTPEVGLHVYRIVAVAPNGLRSDFSSTKAAFSYRLVPGRGCAMR